MLARISSLLRLPPSALLSSGERQDRNGRSVPGCSAIMYARAAWSARDWSRGSPARAHRNGPYGGEDIGGAGENIGRYCADLVTLEAFAW